MTYVALLRGIGPTNPNMHPAKLQRAFERMGFDDVRTVIASGNIVFESSMRNQAAIEKKIETVLPKLLGFSSTTIVRSREELETLVKKNPYKGVPHGRSTYALVTFLKEHSPKLRTLPRKGPHFKVVAVFKKEICVTYDVTKMRTPEFMVTSEKILGKAITSRTWKTVERILAKMDA